jgi:hypothetical protein
MGQTVMECWGCTKVYVTTIHICHPLQINLHAMLFLHHQTPTIDLSIQSYEDSTHNFLKAVTKYKHRVMTAISEWRRHQVGQDSHGGE